MNKHIGASDRVSIAGSALPHVAAATPKGDPDPSTEVMLLAVLRADPDGPQSRSLAEHSRLPWRTRGARRCPSAASDLGRVRAWAEQSGLSVEAVLLDGRVVRLRGEVQHAEAALGVKTVLIDHEGETVLAFHGELSLPAALSGSVVGVLGLDGRPFRRQPSRMMSAEASVTPPYHPADVASMYDFPASHGSGQSIGIIAMGGGFVQSALDTYFTETLGLPMVPTINAITVSGNGNNPSGNGDGEVCLDIEVVGGIAYEATLNVYFGTGGLGGQAACITQAIADGNSVVTSSWGSGWETSFSQNQRDTFDAALQLAADSAVTVLHGAGDQGSWCSKTPPTTTGNQAHVTYPSSSPWMTAAGGTTLTSSSEVVWNRTKSGSTSGGGTGGGVSEIYGVPDYQSGAGLSPVSVNTGVSGRGIPDVASVADPNTGYLISVNGDLKGIGGDSAAGPLWAALIAILNEKLGTPVGFLNPTIYGLAGTGFNDITSGDNSYWYGDVQVPGYDAADGWDACTGWGSPNGTALLQALQQS